MSESSSEGVDVTRLDDAMMIDRRNVTTDGDSRSDGGSTRKDERRWRLDAATTTTTTTFRRGGVVMKKSDAFVFAINLLYYRRYSRPRTS